MSSINLISWAVHVIREGTTTNIYLCSIPRRRNADRRCPSGHHLRRPPRRGAGLRSHAARALHVQRIAPVLPSHLLHHPPSKPRSRFLIAVTHRPLGLLTCPCFYVDGRNGLALDRRLLQTVHVLPRLRRPRARHMRALQLGRGPPTGGQCAKALSRPRSWIAKGHWFWYGQFRHLFLFLFYAGPRAFRA